MKEYNKQYICRNFNRKNKWLGIIDYKSLVILVLYIFFVITLLRIIKISFEYSIYIFLGLVVPVVSVVFININNEVAIDVIFIVIKYYIKKVVFIHKINVKRYKYYKYKKNK